MQLNLEARESLAGIFGTEEAEVTVTAGTPEQVGAVTDWIALNAPGYRIIQRAYNGSEVTLTYRRADQRRHGLPAPLIVTLTSYPDRFGTLAKTLVRILAQSVRPDQVVLWLGHGDEKALPSEVLKLADLGLLVIETTEDVGPYTKFAPALQMYPEAFLITVDDDQIYPLDLIEKLVAGYRGEREVLCRRAHRMLIEDGTVQPYRSWPMDVAEGSAGDDIFATGCAGVLYPPGSLGAEATEAAVFRRLAPTTDDLWLHWMVRRQGWTTRVVGRPWPNQTWDGSQVTSLMSDNWAGGNDKQAAALLDEFGLPSSKPS